MSKRCKCKVCNHARKFEHIIKNLPEKDKSWMEEFYNEYMNVAEDLDWYKATVDFKLRMQMRAGEK